jgi:hypothetical protein
VTSQESAAREGAHPVSVHHLTIRYNKYCSKYTIVMVFLQSVRWRFFFSALLFKNWRRGTILYLAWVGEHPKKARPLHSVKCRGFAFLGHDDVQGSLFLAFVSADEIIVLWLDPKNQRSRLDPLGLNSASARWENVKLATLRQHIFLFACLRFVPGGPAAQVGFL